MFLPRQLTTSRRRAMILMTVLAMLTLFAIVGLTFVFYAQGSQTSSLHWREADQKGFVKPDISPDILMRWGLNQLLYDVPDDLTGQTSSMRGNSLCRNTYGYNDGVLNVQPHNGTGKLHYTHGGGAINTLDDHFLPNYTHFPTDGFLRDPERIYNRANAAAPRQPYTGGFNPPYTYPDMNAMFLGVSRADGTLIQPSFHRPQLFGGNDPATNPNWGNAQGKYQTLRPRPVDMGPGFPYPASATGDVKNRLGAPGGEDSYFMDLNYPVTTAADGRKFKPLFAFHVEAVDGRVNVNASGNLMAGPAAGPTHGSAMGIGRWETTLTRVLDRPGATSEWVNVFLGNATAGLRGRYGPDAAPTAAGNSLPGAKSPRFFNQLDWNAADESANGGITGVLTLPANGQLDPFPRFPAGFGNRSGAARLNHAALFDVLSPGNDDRVLPPSDMYRLLTDSQGGSLAMTADLAQLCPNNFDASFPANIRRRNLVTTISWDLNRMGLSPWLYDRSAPAYLTTMQGAPYPRPQAGQVGLPPLSERTNPTPPGNSDFATNDWRARDAALERIDLARSLPLYPHQAAGSYHARVDLTDAPTVQRYQNAQGARQQMAREIYDRLVLVTAPGSIANPAAPTDAELYPRRYLAQLAVNMVDYLDEDEISTPFNFYTARDAQQANPPTEVLITQPETGEQLSRYWVFGTELPAVVLNEVMAEYRKPAVSGDYFMRVWAELHSPIPTPVGNANLQTQDGALIPFHIPAGGGGPAYSVYRIVLANTSTAAGGPLFNDGGMGARQNITGAPHQVRTFADFNPPGPNNTRTMDPALPAVPIGIDPASTRFFLVTPSGIKDENDTIKAPIVPGNTPVWDAGTGMEYKVAYNVVTDSHNPDDTANGITVLLRRLANPHLPLDDRAIIMTGSPAQPTVNPYYNPYITVDYMEAVPPRDGTGTTFSRIRGQPYVASMFHMHNETPLMPGVDKTVHSFGLRNRGANPQPTWLAWLDREPTSPIEMLQAPEGRMHELTHRFYSNQFNGANAFHSHRVPWFDQDLGNQSLNQSHRHYRLFAHLTVGDRMAGVSPHGRTPGKININMIFEPEILLALLDGQNGGNRNNYFTDNDVYGGANSLWNRMIQTRSPGMLQPTPVITLGDRPFWELDAGLMPAGGGDRNINDTLFRADQAGGDATRPRMFDNPNSPHPALHLEMLNKVYNNVTTRSNTFAVWCTVAFFEVTDETTVPKKLGAEIGAATGTEIRHRFFAIVDRTQFAIADHLCLQADAVINPSSSSQTMTINPTASSPAVFTGPGLNGTISYHGSGAVTWNIAPNSVLVIDRGTAREETVVVTGVGANSFDAVFRRQHVAGAKITMYGNPGPQPFNSFFPTNALNGPVLPVAVVLQ